MQAIRAFHPGEAGRERRVRRDPVSSPETSHSRSGTQAPDVLPDPAGADDAHGLALEQHRTVGAVVESMTLSIAMRVREPSREVEEAGENVLGHGPSIPEAS